MTELGRVQRTCEERERLVGLLLDNNIPLDRVERDTAARLGPVAQTIAVETIEFREGVTDPVRPWPYPEVL